LSILRSRASLSDWIDDQIVFRSLEPVDRRLPAWPSISETLGLPSFPPPRKSESTYAKAVLAILTQAQALRGARPLGGLLYLGDTHLLDGQAFRHLISASGWPGRAFLADENRSVPPSLQQEGSLWLSNRWSALPRFLEAGAPQGGPLGDEVAAVIDFDKTAIGARGRNDHPLDEARLEGVRSTVQDALGKRFDESSFRKIYQEFNQPSFHSFTGDNQDLVAYLCLMLMSEVYPESVFRADLHNGSLSHFSAFARHCDLTLRREKGDHPVITVHQEVFAKIQQGDPTPFKRFRRQEYLATCRLMDWLPDDVPASRLLTDEICLTEEVATGISTLQQSGVLCFCISDKPEEASLPTPELAELGYKPLHRTQMKVLGMDITPVATNTGSSEPGTN